MNPHKNLIYNVNWGTPTNFRLRAINLVNSNSSLTDSCIFKDATTFSTNWVFINTAILGISTPSVSSQPIEEWIGGSWSYSNGRPELRQIDMTFRDTADGLLWKNFIYLYDFLKNAYPNDAKWHIVLESLSLEHVNRGAIIGNNVGTLIDTSTAILTHIGQLTYSKDQADAFTTFTVTFKYHNYRHDNEVSGLAKSAVSLKEDKKMGSPPPNGMDWGSISSN
jgi:hypothetical protein